MTVKIFQSRLFLQMIGLIVTVALVPIGFLGYRLVQINQRALENQLFEYHTQLASATASQVRQSIAGTIDGLVETGQVLVVTRQMSAPEIKNLFLYFMANDETISYIAYLDGSMKKVVTVGTGDVGGEFPDLEVFLAESSSAMRAKREWVVGRAIPFPAAETVLLPLAVPIVDPSTGSTVGVLGAYVNLSKVQELVTRVRLRKKGFVFLIDGDGRLLAHPDRAMVLRRADMRELEIVSQFLRIGRTGGTIPFVDQGEEMLGAYEPVPDLGWGIILQEPKREAYISISMMTRQTVLLLVVTGLLSGVIGGLYASRLTKPLSNFTAGALAIAKGDFRTEINVKARNELGQLARTFNYMCQQLDIYNQDMRELLLGSLKSLAAAIDAKDPYTRGHSERVTRVSLAIAREMGIKGKEMDTVNMTALLHDVGKIGIEDDILRKPGLLTKEEYGVIKRHPVIGSEIMGAIKQLREVVPGIRHHHEAFDGSGYPDGLKGEAIPLTARIIALADCFDAMTSERPYQKAMTDDYVIEVMGKMSGERFDPQVVEAFFAAYGKAEILRRMSEEAAS